MVNPERRRWLDNLPALLQQLTERWSLRVGAPFDHANVTCSWVAPVVRAGGQPGDPAFDVVQHLYNCETRLHADPVGMVKRIADLAEVDDERAALWTFARAAADPRPSWDNLLWMDIARALDH